jgi:LmbE family N-acetylglucosaminyl deacetylase
VSPAIVLAPHPDDEVLGASTILRHGPTTVVHVTDGVPPWTDPTACATLLERRRAECAAAWDVLGADVAGCIQLGFDDLAVWRAVPQLADALTDHLAASEPATVHVPAHQGGHPDHDATFAAALLARRRTGGRHAWRVYGLYGYPSSGRLAFGALERSHYQHAKRVGDTTTELERKAAALRCFTSQLFAGSIVQRWLDAPAAEADAPLPDGLPTNVAACFYEQELDFTRFGVTAAAVRVALDLALTDST